jgi:hypothetical protein
MGDLFGGGQGGGGTTRAAAGRGATCRSSCASACARRPWARPRRSRCKKQVACSACQGSGAAPGSRPQNCGPASGMGRVRQVRQSLLGQMMTETVCPACRGRGQVISDPCGNCRGTGTVRGEETLEIKVPAGVSTGNYMEMRGKGDQGEQGGPMGNLRVVMEVAEDDLFVRHDDDVLLDVPVSPIDLMLGIKLTVPDARRQGRAQGAARHPEPQDLPPARQGHPAPEPPGRRRPARARARLDPARPERPSRSGACRSCARTWPARCRSRGGISTTETNGCDSPDPDSPCTMRRFFIERPDQRPLRPGQRLVLDAEESKHILTVLRAETGAVLALTDGGGCAIEAELIGTHKRSCEVRVTRVTPVTEEIAPPLLHLACAVVKGRRFEYALEKAVELGVHAITPLAVRARGRRSARGQAGPLARPADRRAQAERTLPPAAAAIAGRTRRRARGGRRPGLVRGGAVDLGQADRRGMTARGARRRGRAGAGAPDPGELLLLIGPEGGWTAAERPCSPVAAPGRWTSARTSCAPRRPLPPASWRCRRCAPRGGAVNGRPARGGLDRPRGGAPPSSPPAAIPPTKGPSHAQRHRRPPAAGRHRRDEGPRQGPPRRAAPAPGRAEAGRGRRAPRAGRRRGDQGVAELREEGPRHARRAPSRPVAPRWPTAARSRAGSGRELPAGGA